jgi:multidrug resistance efflux pump
MAVSVLALVCLVVLATRGDSVPTVDMAEVVVDTARVAPFRLEVRGSGTLAPEQLRWIAAPTSARVDRVVVQSGTEVSAGDELLRLVNPDVEIQSLQADQQLSQAEATLMDLRLGLQQQVLSQEGAVAMLRTQWQDATLQATAAESLLVKNLISRLEALNRRALSEELTIRMRLEQERLALVRTAADSQVARQEQQVRRLAAIAAFQQSRREALQVRAPEGGVVQDLQLQPGQWVTEGTMLAKVVRPGRLKAVLRVAESQAKDVMVGQEVTIDIRTATIAGHVSRKDPAAQAGYVTVDVALPEPLPPGAVPDLNVDGVIQVASLGEVLLIGRPASRALDGDVRLYRIDEDGRHATRVAVRLGRASMTHVQVERGLEAGNRVILSELPELSSHDRIRITQRNAR